MNNDNEDPIPRELMALVVLHGLLSGSPFDLYSAVEIGDYARLAFAFADAMKQQGAQ